MSIFEQASYFTLDDVMKEMLLKCGKNIFPKEFKVANNKIHTKTGNSYPIPLDPMELYNLIHDIMNGTEPAKRVAASSVVRKKVDICDDAIDLFSKTKGRDPSHAKKISACIYTAIYMGYINGRDFIYHGNIISSIRGIDTDGPSILHKRRR